MVLDRVGTFVRAFWVGGMSKQLLKPTLTSCSGVQVNPAKEATVFVLGLRHSWPIGIHTLYSIEYSGLFPASLAR
jgi:hypothetical protein